MTLVIPHTYTRAIVKQKTSCLFLLWHSTIINICGRFIMCQKKTHRRIGITKYVALRIHSHQFTCSFQHPTVQVSWYLHSYIIFLFLQYSWCFIIKYRQIFKKKCSGCPTFTTATMCQQLMINLLMQQVFLYKVLDNILWYDNENEVD